MAEQRIRPARVSSVVREVVANAIAFEMKDPRVAGVTVSDVEVTGDLREAKVFVHVNGDQAEVDAALEALRNGAGWLRRKIGGQVRLRHTPRLDFRFDKSLEYGSRIEAKLRELGLGGAPADEPDESSVADAQAHPDGPLVFAEASVSDGPSVSDEPSVADEQADADEQAP